MTRRGWMLFISLGVIWGLPYLLIRIAIRDISPPTLVFLRTAPAGLILLPLVLKSGNFAVLRAHWRAVLAFTVAELAIPWLLLFRSEQRLPSSVAGLLVATVPLITALLTWIGRFEGFLGLRRLAGLAVGFIGVAILVGIEIHGTELIAVAEILIVALGYSLGPLIIARYLQGVSAMLVVATSLILTATAYAPVALTHLPKRVGLEEVVSVVLLALVCTDLAFLVFFKLITEVGPTKATVITYVNPAVAVLLGVAILNEHFSLGIALGFPFILVGSYLGTGGLHRRLPGEVLASKQNEQSSFVVHGDRKAT